MTAAPSCPRSASRTPGRRSAPSRARSPRCSLHALADLDGPERSLVARALRGRSRCAHRRLARVPALPSPAAASVSDSFAGACASRGSSSPRRRLPPGVRHLPLRVVDRMYRMAVDQSAFEPRTPHRVVRLSATRRRRHRSLRPRRPHVLHAFRARAQARHVSTGVTLVRRQHATRSLRSASWR